GITYTTSGNYGAVYSYPYCDTVWLILTVLPSTSNVINITNCNSYTWPLNGLTYTQSGNYTATVGCQTTQLQLNIIHSNNTTTNISSCTAYTWLANGITYTNSGNYFIASGCDTQFLNLVIVPTSFISSSISACNAYTWPINGITYTNSGLYQVMNGCDTQQLNLTINYGTNSVQTISAFNNYSWSVSGLTYTNSGVYTSTNLNAFGCIDSYTLNLTIILSGLVSISTIQDQSVSCYGLNDGSCQASGFPVGNYIYSLDGGLQTNSTGFFGGLTPGIHTVCATDGLNTFCDTLLIFEPDSLIIQFVTDSIVSCQGNDGALSVLISGGTNSLQGYLTWWTNANGDTLNNVLTNNFATNLSNLSVGTYNVVVEDDHGCFATQSGNLISAPLLTISASSNSILCFGGNTQIIPLASGGSNYLPYTYLINGMPVLNNYLAGIYTIQATDSKGCSSTVLFSITEPDLISDTSIINACSPFTWNGNQYLISGIYTNTFISINGCDSLHTIILTINNGIRFSPKVLLSGCYESNGLMHDSLRATGQIPLTEPYTAMNFVPIGYAGGEMISSQQLALIGSNAIVDWVHIEVRSSSPTYNKIASMNALLQRDGDIVDVNGNSLYFPNICPSNYYISIKHRNHLGVMTATSLALDSLDQVIDFTNSNPVWVKPGLVNTPRKTVGSYSLLWAGDSRVDKNVKYVGLNNDKEPILYAVGNATINNILYPVYRTEDVNMDARVKYNNSDNDKNFILNQVLISNPLIPSPNAVISQHTPN
ncbi:MAG TPA: hypothetical protein PLU17_11335, partial [Chitinophagaceae bacterium]|nr:hypothetical protein [Chitinophagaceae bacterium]